jgi:hypothetical protein
VNELDDIERLSRNAQRSAEARLFDCMDGLYDDEVGDSAIGPFCGCYTCIVREVLDAAWPWLYEAATHPDVIPPVLESD